MEIMNTSILEGTFPKKLKLAKVVPVFKSGWDTDPIIIVLFLCSLYSTESLKD